MIYKYNSNVYFDEVSYITCPNCNSKIDMSDRGSWHSDKYLCNDCLKYYKIEFLFEVAKCEK